MTKEKLLFIGGSHDGKRHHVPDELPFVHLIKKHDSLPCFTHFKLYPQLDDEIEEYRLTPFRGDDRTFFVYAISNLSPSDVIANLISKYPTQEHQT